MKPNSIKLIPVLLFPLVAVAAPAQAETPAPQLQVAFAGASSDTTAAQVATVAGEPAAEEEAAPPLGVPVTVHGSYFSRYELRSGYDTLGVSRARFQEGDRAVYRFRTSFTTGPIDVGKGNSVVLQFSPQASGFYPGNGSANNVNATIGETDLGVVEGFMRLQNAAYALDVGRFIMNYGNSAVIGSLDWHQAARSFQGARLRLNVGEGGFTDFFVTQLREGAPGNDDFLAGDAYFAGAYAGLGALIEPLKVLDVYALVNGVGVTANGDGGRVPGAVEATIGSLIKGGAGILDYQAEGGVQFGKRVAGGASRDVFAFNIEGELGLKLAPGFRVAGYGAFVSGDDGDGQGSIGSWNELYPTTHKFFGLTDVMGFRSNIADAALRFAFKSSSGVIFKADFHNFFRPNTAGQGGAFYQNQEKGYAGSEANLHAIYIIGKGLKVRAMYGVFVPNKDTFGGNDDPANYFELELRYDI